MVSRAYGMPSDDPRLWVAAEAARLYLDHFRLLAPHGEPAAVKVPLTGDVLVLADVDAPAEPVQVTEQVWLADVEVGEASVSGRLLNRPVELDGAPGMQVDVPIDEVADWIVGIGGRATGGFSVQVVRASLGRWARRRHDRAWGLRFPRPDQVCTYAGPEGEMVVPLPRPDAR